MRKVLLVLILISIIPFSCKKKAEEQVIPRKEFVKILTEMHLMDGMMAEKKIREDLVTNDSTDYYEALFNHHGYTRAQFDSSVTYYSRDLKKFEKIYQEVIANLNKMETHAREELKEQRENKEKETKEKPKPQPKPVERKKDTEQQ